MPHPNFPTKFPGALATVQEMDEDKALVVQEVAAIEQALGVNLANVGGSGGTSPGIVLTATTDTLLLQALANEAILKGFTGVALEAGSVGSFFMDGVTGDISISSTGTGDVFIRGNANVGLTSVGTVQISGSAGVILGGATNHRVGFYGVPGINQPTVTGDKNANLKAVVTSILAALAAQGLVVDGTT